ASGIPDSKKKSDANASKSKDSQENSRDSEDNVFGMEQTQCDTIGCIFGLLCADLDRSAYSHHHSDKYPHVWPRRSGTSCCAICRQSRGPGNGECAGGVGRQAPEALVRIALGGADVRHASFCGQRSFQGTPECDER